jgi:hypothetical protein
MSAPEFWPYQVECRETPGPTRRRALVDARLKAEPRAAPLGDTGLRDAIGMRDIRSRVR